MNPNLVGTLILLTLACCSESVSNNICDTCKCQPSASPEKAKSVECICDNKTQTINTTIENMKNLPHLETFTVINCEAVNFHRQSFGDSHDLTDVILRKVKTAVFPLGVFAKLDVLKIEYVDDLRLTENAFMGAEIGEITIRYSSIKEIPARALFNIKLRKLELTEVNIGLVKSNSTYLVMGEQSSLIIDGCQLGEVETGGMELKAQKLRMSGTNLTHLAPSAIIINAAIGVDISSSTFGTIATDGMFISSKTINLYNNTFESIPITLELMGKGGKITITHNVLYDLPVNATILGLINAEIARNYFLCDCKLAQNLLTFAPTVTSAYPHFYEALTSNFCKSNCSYELPLKALYDKAQTCDSETEVNLCNAAEANATANADENGRGGRKVDDQDEPRTIGETLGTPDEKSPLTSDQPTCGTSNVQMFAFLLALFVLS